MSFNGIYFFNYVGHIPAVLPGQIVPVYAVDSETVSLDPAAGVPLGVVAVAVECPPGQIAVAVTPPADDPPEPLSPTRRTCDGS